MTIHVRPATTDDRDAIVDVFLGCWRQSYAGFVPQFAIEAMTHERASSLWTGLLAKCRGTVLVAECELRVMGVTRFEIHEDTGIVASLYVSPHAHGRGIGTLLLERATAAMRKDVPRNLMLWVFADNTPSVGFYRRLGWLPDGHSRTQDEFGVLELRLAFQEVAP